MFYWQVLSTNRIMQVLITELKTISDILFSNTTRYARHNSLVDLLATKSHFFVSRDKRDLLWKHIATARLFPQTKHFDDLIFQVFNLSLRTLSWVSPLLMICFVNNILKKKCFEMNKSWIFCENVSIATARLFHKTKRFDDFIFQVFNLSFNLYLCGSVLYYCLFYINPHLICFCTHLWWKSTTWFWNEHVIDLDQL